MQEDPVIKYKDLIITLLSVSDYHGHFLNFFPLHFPLKLFLEQIKPLPWHKGKNDLLRIE